MGTYNLYGSDDEFLRENGFLISKGKSKRISTTKVVSMMDVQEAYYSAGRVEKDIQAYLYYVDITLNDLSKALAVGNEELVVSLYMSLQELRAALIKREYFNMMEACHVD